MHFARQIKILNKNTHVLVLSEGIISFSKPTQMPSAGKRHNFPRSMNYGNNFPQNTRESKFVAFRDKSAYY